ncbi:MAG: hypothetical protein M0R77_03090 [Gammaproteobacteria bacterium]|nr:hypothetical protein [Gammaproteobacteria bacterium]
MENNHLLRTVYVVFDEFNGFKTKNGWNKSFRLAKIFTHKTYALNTHDVKKELKKPDTTVRLVPIQMMIEEADYTALKLGGYLEGPEL